MSNLRVGISMNPQPPAYDLPRITLGVLALGVMTAASIWVMLPFLAAVVWAAMIVIATWPVLAAVQARLGGHRGPAVAVMVVALLALLVVPTWLGISTIADNSERIGKLVHSLTTDGLPPPRTGWEGCRSWARGCPKAGARWPGIPRHSWPGSSPT